MSSSFSRRVFLAGLGASAAWLPIVGARNVWGDTVFPKRLLVVFKPNGTYGESFWPNVADDPHPVYQTGALAGMKFPEIVKPLEPHQSDLIFVRGMDFTAQIRMAAEAHQSGLQALTGKTKPDMTATAEEGRSGTGISVDQWIANQIAKTTTLQVPLLTVGVACKSDSYTWISFRDAGQPNSPETNPYTLFDKIFGSQQLTPADLDRIRLERKTVLDYLGPSLTRFSQRLGKDDQLKVQSHLEAIRALESQLSVTTPAAVAPKLGQPLDVNADVNLPAVLNAQMDLVVAALSADLTRVCTFNLMDGGGNHTMSWLGQEFSGVVGESSISPNGLETHHTISHNDDAYMGRRKIAAETWIMSQFALLLEKMKAVKEGSGTLLDNTMVVLIDNMSFGAKHTMDDIPLIVAGRAGGYLQPGRLVNFQVGDQNIPHNGLLCAMGNAMGFPLASFGDADLGGEPAGLRMPS